MKIITKLILIIIVLTCYNCNQNKAERAIIAFKEGVQLSLKADEVTALNQPVAAKAFYQKAIEKFKRTLYLDPTHKKVESSIGLTYYELEEYDEAQIWFEKAAERNPNDAFNFRFLGLSQINKGKIEKGEKNIRQAFTIDTSKAFRDGTITYLVNIGNTAFNSGEGFMLEGNTKRENDYKNFGIRVLWSAFNFSDKDPKIATLIQKYADKMDDETLTNWLKNEMGK